MNDTAKLTDLYPQSLWKNFATLCEIPRLSGHEQKTIEHIKNFTTSLGLETIIDDVGNVIVRKPASSGMEQHKSIILQAHVDMVGEKGKDVVHDFTKDLILPYIANEVVKARGTTLGADNGIGVAAILAVLEANDIAHGPLEALFTISEEVGLKGAMALKPNLLKSDILLNLDNEVEGELLIGSAGATRTLTTINYGRDITPKDVIGYEIKVAGLPGGHSGTDIHLRHGNAIKILNRLLMGASKKYNIRIAEFNGGVASNVIPSEAKAIITLAANDQDSFADFIAEFKTHISQITDISLNNAVTISATATETPKSVFDLAGQHLFLKSIFLCPHGVMSMNPKIANLVESSTNLAIVKNLKNTIEIYTMQRSTDDFLLDEVSLMIESAFTLIGGKVDHYISYYGWAPNSKSPLMLLAEEIYQKKFGKALNLTVINAGIECSAFRTSYPNIDMTSFGPTIYNAHSANEAVDIKSVGRFWDFLVELLKNIP
jgi:dipeptidase D